MVAHAAEDDGERHAEGAGERIEHGHLNARADGRQPEDAIVQLTRDRAPCRGIEACEPLTRFPDGGKRGWLILDGDGTQRGHLAPANGTTVQLHPHGDVLDAVEPSGRDHERMEQGHIQRERVERLDAGLGRHGVSVHASMAALRTLTAVGGIVWCAHSRVR